MIHDNETADRGDASASASTGELVAQLADQSKELVKKEVDLAKAELRTEVKNEIKLALGFAVAGFLAFFAFELLLAALVLGLAEAMPGWAAALVAAGAAIVLALIAAFAGWRYRVTHPLPKTRKTLKEDAQWVQHGLT